MVAINLKFILLALSAARTLAMPVEAEAEGLLDTLDRVSWPYSPDMMIWRDFTVYLQRDNELTSSYQQRLICTVDGKKYSFSENAAKALARKAPAGDAKTLSGYPHIFGNADSPQIKWDNQACMSKKVKTLEFPIFENGKEFDWGKKNQQAGLCRVVYSQKGGHFCGVMCHRTGNKKDQESRKFKKCN
jgi:hypothetical protein